MTEPLKPGEIEMDDLPPSDPVNPPADPAADPEPDPADPAADPAPDPADPAADPAKPPRKLTGAVAELVGLRKEKKQLAERLAAIESNPVLQRLTPEVQQAILDGRLQILPPQSTREAEQTRLKEVAETLQLFKVDANNQTVPDLDAAKRVDSFVRGTVREAVEPERLARLSGTARSNYDKAIAHAEREGYDVDSVREVFDEVLSQPNGAELLSKSKVCERMWETAVGRAHTRGKPTGKAKPEAGKKPPAAIITEPAGARPGQGGTVQLSPGLQRIYKDHGVNPDKAFSATRKIDPFVPIDLE